MTIGEAVLYSFRHSYDKRASRLEASDVSIRSEELCLPPAALDASSPVRLPAPFSAGRTPLANLATLLYAGAGVRSAELIDADPAGIVLHRTTPAPGGMSAVELFVSLAWQGDWRRTFYYSPHRHQLLPVRDSGVERVGNTGIAVCVHPDRLAGKYTNFSPRLALLQAGHAIGAIENVADTLGLRGGWTHDVAAQANGPEQLPAGLECLAWFDLDISAAVVADQERLARLEQETLSRTSGDLAATGTGWYRHDLDTPTTIDILARVARSVSPNIDVVCIASRVAEAARGLYTYDHQTKQFVKSPIGEALPATAIGNRKYVTADSYALIWLLLTDSNAAFAELGTRYYAELNLACGAIAQGICLTAAAHGLAARPLCDFDERVLDSWLGAEFAGLNPAYVVVVGPARRPTEYQVNWNHGDESRGR